MKKSILFLVSFVFLCASMFLAHAEERIDRDTEDEQAVLRFSSFAGGGYEYTVEIDDPSIVSCETKYEYEPHAEEIDGASYDFVAEFTGLIPGSTKARVYGRSPILENEDSIYAVKVDDSLHVSLTPVRMISSFSLYRNGEIRYDSYQLSLDKDGYTVSIDEEPAQPIRTESVEALMNVIDTYNVISWNGFDESNDYVLDGEGFWLDISFTDGTSISAQGDNAFPERYFDAMGAMWDILTHITETETETETEADGMKLFIDGTQVPVTWEENDSVKELKKILPLTVQMSTYGGFEQVGNLGQSIVRDDKQTKTAAGDIVLYSGDQIVIFYGFNSWAYTSVSVGLNRPFSIGHI
jgi:hypothetical protein